MADSHNHAQHHEHHHGMQQQAGASVMQGDMAHHGGESSFHTMMMWFHGGANEVILFSFWRVDSLGGFLVALFVTFVLAILYEGIKAFRDWEFSRRSQELKPSQNHEDSESSKVQSCIVRILEANMFSSLHLLQTALHMMQSFLSFALMLIVMTYNSWLIGAVVLGLAVGYFLFGWRKTTIMQRAPDGCCE